MNRCLPVLAGVMAALVAEASVPAGAAAQGLGRRPEQAEGLAAPDGSGDGWPTATPADVGLDPAPIREMVEHVRAGVHPNIHSVLLVKDGRLVVEEYFHGYDRERLHAQASVTKSVLSLLVGIAVDDGAIGGVDAPLSRYFREDLARVADGDRKGAIPLRNLLTMSAGLEWHAVGIPRRDPRHSTYRMWKSDDPVGFVLGRRVVAEPGREWYYNSGLSILLGEVVRKATGTPVDAYARDRLFAPLGIRRFRWDGSPSGVVQTEGGLHLRPRDMAKIGLLVLRRGAWEGRAVVSPGWIAESTRRHIHAWTVGYGYQWRRGWAEAGSREVDVVYAAGHGGQRIFLVPASDLVAVFTSRVFDNPGGHARPEGMLVRYVLPALLGPEEPPEAVDLPAGRLQALAGRYQHRYEPFVARIWVEDGKLVGLSPEGERLEGTARSPRLFTGTSEQFGPFRIAFAEGDSGAVETLWFRFGLKEIPFDRIE